jgi:hypothetical protein
MPVLVILMPSPSKTASNAAVYLLSRIPDQVFHGGAGVLEVHDQVAGRLRRPGRGGMGCGAEDADAAGGVFDDGEDVQPCSGQCPGLEEVGGEDRVCLAAQEALVWWSRCGRGSMPVSLRISQTVEGATLMPRTASSPWMRL